MASQAAEEFHAIKNPQATVLAARNAGMQVERVSAAELHNKFLPHRLAAAEEIGMLLG
jgi:hypothetical protein